MLHLFEQALKSTVAPCVADQAEAGCAEAGLSLTTGDPSTIVAHGLRPSIDKHSGPPSSRVLLRLQRIDWVHIIGQNLTEQLCPACYCLRRKSLSV